MIHTSMGPRPGPYLLAETPNYNFVDLEMLPNVVLSIELTKHNYVSLLKCNKTQWRLQSGSYGFMCMDNAASAHKTLCK